MKFLNKINLRRLANVAAISGSIFFGSNSVADAAPLNNDDVWAFREA